MMVEPPSPNLALFLLDLTERLDNASDDDKALRVLLRLTRDFFAADAVCAAIFRGRREAPDVRFVAPPEAAFKSEYLSGALRGRHLELPDHTVVAPLERRGHAWGMLAVRFGLSGPDAEAIAAVGDVARVASRIIQRMDRRRTVDVRSRLDRKILEQIRPTDLFYQILHGLRTLTEYDHSAALLIRDEATGDLELVAEQIAWKKGKSERIGTSFAVSEPMRLLLQTGDVYGFDRRRDGWTEWDERDADALARLLDYNASDPGAGAREGTILCAPLRTQGRTVGVLKVAARQPGTLSRYEGELVRSFGPYASVAIRNLKRTESLETGMLEAEKRSAVATLARGVAHDINNAFGAVLPLVQQVRRESGRGTIDPEVLRKDLERIESSLHVCRRIFSGMLAFARGSAPGADGANIRRAVESTLDVLEDGMTRQGVVVEVNLDERLPLVPAAQSDLEQIILNLATNARDAMPSGGTLGIDARGGEEGVVLAIQDSGVGMPAEVVARAGEPFYTTKEHGSGLGLSICRSIVWNMGGRMNIESAPGEGTRVTILIPAEETVELPREEGERS